MDDLVRYRAMESLCRQKAVFRPLESWRLLAEAEMWHHKAQEEIASRVMECSVSLPADASVEIRASPVAGGLSPRGRSANAIAVEVR